MEQGEGRRELRVGKSFVVETKVAEGKTSGEKKTTKNKKKERKIIGGGGLLIEELLLLKKKARCTSRSRRTKSCTISRISRRSKSTSRIRMMGVISREGRAVIVEKREVLEEDRKGGFRETENTLQSKVDGKQLHSIYRCKRRQRAAESRVKGDCRTPNPVLRSGDISVSRYPV